LSARFFKVKLFDKETRRFITKEYLCYWEEDEIKEFVSFSEFYEYLDADLKNANLHNYDFAGVNLRNFNIEGAYISSDILIEQDLYDDSFYTENILDHNHNIELMISAENEIVEAGNILHDSDLISNSPLDFSCCRIYYISDIHLNHKLLKVFPSHATKLEVTRYIRWLVKKMVATVTNKPYFDYLLIAGDISFNFEISKIFYKEVTNHWNPNKIVAVLGNHELWNFIGDVPVNTIDKIVQRYRNMFKGLGIRFLQNDLLTSNGTIVSEKRLMSIDPGKLKQICLKSSFVILGGLGYSGLNSYFNATCGIYRETIKSLDEDIEQTKRFESIYKKVEDAIDRDKVIILTHTPKEDWTNENYNKNWIYVNGHTHRNDYSCCEEKTVYSDNQIGYYTGSIGLKHFSLSNNYDIFRYHPDGIYIISREQYLDFNVGVGISATYNRIGKIHMLKNNNIYCFMFENIKTRKLYLLNGGAINKLEHSDIHYYFERMAYYSDTIRELFSGYNQALKSISNSVKAIGGAGTIHGCIVDIDFYNHLYIDPMDGSISSYYATSIIDKHYYRDIEALLLDKRPDLYDNYKKLLGEMCEGVRLLRGETKVESIEISRFVPETNMYRPSRIIRALQYLTDVNVIRIWNDRVMDIHSEDENRITPFEKRNKTILLPEAK
jgi:predicted MPP superfamily phosphohydrolase